MKTKFSKHMIEDRMERYAVIATKVGFGEVIFSTIREPEGRVTERRLLQMTSTGVCIVRSMEDVVITMFCATISITKCYFPNQELSPALVRTIRFNERKGYCNIQVAVVMQQWGRLLHLF